MSSKTAISSIDVHQRDEIYSRVAIKDQKNMQFVTRHCFAKSKAYGNEIENASV